MSYDDVLSNPAVTGFRYYMRSVFNYLSLGLLVSGLVAVLVSSSPAALAFFFGSKLMYWVTLLAPLVLCFGLSWACSNFSMPVARLYYFLFTGSFGVSLSTIFLVYHLGSIVSVFFVAAAMFAACGWFGYFTNRDLSGMGAFFMMVLVGLLVAMIINVFLASSAMAFIINVIGVVLFAGLTAYDMQKIKENYSPGLSGESNERNALMGATSLYLDFLNLFLFLLELFGQKD